MITHELVIQLLLVLAGIGLGVIGVYICFILAFMKGHR